MAIQEISDMITGIAGSAAQGIPGGKWGCHGNQGTQYFPGDVSSNSERSMVIISGAQQRAQQTNEL